MSIPQNQCYSNVKTQNLQKSRVHLAFHSAWKEIKVAKCSTGPDWSRIGSPKPGQANVTHSDSSDATTNESNLKLESALSSAIPSIDDTMSTDDEYLQSLFESQDPLWQAMSVLGVSDEDDIPSTIPITELKDLGTSGVETTSKDAGKKRRKSPDVNRSQAIQDGALRKGNSNDLQELLNELSEDKVEDEKDKIEPESAGDSIESWMKTILASDMKVQAGILPVQPTSFDSRMKKDKVSRNKKSMTQATGQQALDVWEDMTMPPEVTRSAPKRRQATYKEKEDLAYGAYLDDNEPEKASQVKYFKDVWRNLESETVIDTSSDKWQQLMQDLGFKDSITESQIGKERSQPSGFKPSKSKDYTKEVPGRLQYRAALEVAMSVPRLGHKSGHFMYGCDPSCKCGGPLGWCSKTVRSEFGMRFQLLSSTSEEYALSKRFSSRGTRIPRDTVSYIRQRGGYELATARLYRLQSSVQQAIVNTVAGWLLEVIKSEPKLYSDRSWGYDEIVNENGDPRGPTPREQDTNASGPGSWESDDEVYSSSTEQAFSRDGGVSGQYTSNASQDDEDEARAMEPVLEDEQAESMLTSEELPVSPVMGITLTYCLTEDKQFQVPVLSVAAANRCLHLMFQHQPLSPGEQSFREGEANSENMHLGVGGKAPWQILDEGGGLPDIHSTAGFEDDSSTSVQQAVMSPLVSLLSFRDPVLVSSAWSSDKGTKLAGLLGISPSDLPRIYDMEEIGESGGWQMSKNELMVRFVGADYAVPFPAPNTINDPKTMRMLTLRAHEPRLLYLQMRLFHHSHFRCTYCEADLWSNNNNSLITCDHKGCNAKFGTYKSYYRHVQTHNHVPLITYSGSTCEHCMRSRFVRV